MAEPRIHSHHEDGLPETHPQAYVQTYCSEPGCNECLHAGNNECMQTWVETGAGNFCLAHAAKRLGQSMDGDYALPDMPLDQERQQVQDMLDRALDVSKENASIRGQLDACRSEIVRLRKRMEPE